MNDKLRIGYFADGKWAHESFKLLVQDPTIDIRFVCARFESQDLELERMSKERGIDFLKHRAINSVEFIDSVKKYDCDLFVSMSFNQIFKKDILNLPRLKTINCHAGKLPFYRGRNILNWALINDDKEFGITVHFVDEGIDTGDIILQRVYQITDDDDYRTLLEKSYVGCADILYHAIKLLQAGTFQRIPQHMIHPVGFYCGMRKEGDELICWNQSSRELFNFIRALCRPGPMATSFLKGKSIKINKAKMIENAISYKGINGQVVGQKNGGFIVKTCDTCLEISEYDYEGVVRIGDRLG